VTGWGGNIWGFTFTLHVNKKSSRFFFLNQGDMSNCEAVIFKLFSSHVIYVAGNEKKAGWSQGKRVSGV